MELYTRPQFLSRIEDLNSIYNGLLQDGDVPEDARIEPVDGCLFLALMCQWRKADAAVSYNRKGQNRLGASFCLFDTSGTAGIPINKSVGQALWLKSPVELVKVDLQISQKRSPDGVVVYVGHGYNTQSGLLQETPLLIRAPGYELFCDKVMLSGGVVCDYEVRLICK